MSALYTARNLKFSYRLGAQTVEALRGVSLDIGRGEMVSLSGPSGSGKSTLLNLFGLIEPVQEGRLVMDGTDLATIDEAERNSIRRHRIGFVFQRFLLFPVLDARENVEFFLERQGVPAAERRRRSMEALEAVGLIGHERKRPLEMSGGQRQRVAVARAIAKNPEIIIADEPTANLDQATGRGIMEIFARLNVERDVTVLVASHDPMVLSFTPRKLSLLDGRIADGDEPAAVHAGLPAEEGGL